MQYDLLSIAFYPPLKRWLPDINKVKFREDVETDPIEFTILFLQMNNKTSSNNSLPYYKNKFTFKRKLTNDSECFILDECIRSNVGSLDLIEHFIIVEKYTNEYILKCPKCGKTPESILSLNYDSNLVMNVRKEYSEWNSDLK